MYKASITTQQFANMCQTEYLILDVDSSRDETLYRLPVARNLHDVNLERAPNWSVTSLHASRQSRATN